MDRSKPKKAGQSITAKKGVRKSAGRVKDSLKTLEHGNGDSQDRDMVRTTVMMPRVLDQNWEAYALREGKQKNEVLIAALTKFLIDENFQPDKKPRIDITY